MKIFFSPASPYVRKTLASAHLLGLFDTIELLPSAASPVARDMTIAPTNPLGKVPTAYLDDGTALIDSRTICEYLHEQAPEKGLFPAGKARWEALRLHAIADGLLDAALLARYEVAMRPENLRWNDWLAGQMGKIDAAVAALEASVDQLQGREDIGSITAGCALGYLDFRFPDHDWRSAAPNLAQWWEAFAQTPPMAQTVPH
ncbi:glutathione S-transferase family protein [Pararhodobacter marinus]|uniref:Glutathione S-transferase n=1 Tax=Pararhodobacter marinus TaxID=2184063 RepID=A0A2U2CAL0_9RHOB|nr:glutathione S-transferase family protein [Pararhodobacter marinus]PWE28926.1 glutathione S-transferase [Pararhodobacter marinus]